MLTFNKSKKQRKHKNEYPAIKGEINISMTNYENFYSPYSMEGSELINESLESYIMGNTEFDKLGRELEINIHTKEPLNTSEMQKIENTLKREFAQNLSLLENKTRREHIFGLFCLSFGLIFATLLIIEFLFLNSIIIEVFLEVFTWILLWEGVDYLFLSQHSSRIEKIKYERIINAKVNFFNT